MIITIDGPTASGKSTAAQLLAKKLGFYYLNSGLLYRALAYLLIKNRHYTLETLKKPDIHDLAIYLDITKLIYRQDEHNMPHIFFDQTDITEHLKGALIDQGASIISACKEVREKLVDYQRHFGTLYNLVADGRDMGTVIFPDADYKFYLTASREVRAARWQQHEARRGNIYSMEKATQELMMRDERDTNRAIAPLKVPKDAIVIDNSAYSIEETVVIIGKHL